MIVNEIFHSVQGEGPFIGIPCIFVRLATCNLRCEWCDSKYAYQGKEMSVEQMFKEIIKYPASNIVVTGGEPMLQLEGISELQNHIQEREPNRYTWHIETNGTIYSEDVRSLFEIVVVSPKFQSIKMEVLNEYAYEDAYFKFVIDDMKDFKEAEKLVDKLNLEKSQVFMMPQGVTKAAVIEKSKWLIENVCKPFDYKFSPRLHVMLWGMKRRV